MTIPTLPPTSSLPRFIAFDDCKKGETSAKTGCTPVSGGGGKKESDGEDEPSRIKGAGKAIWKALNAWPTIAQAVVKETGVSPRVAKAAYVMSMAGDFTVPGLPVGSAAVIVAATIKNPVAPIRAAKKAIQQAKEKLSKVKGGTMGENEGTPGNLEYVAKSIDSKENKELYIQLLATAMEEVGDLKESIKIADLAYENMNK